MTAGAGGKGASLDANWSVTLNKQTTHMGVSGSLSLNYPSQISWSRDQSRFNAEISLSSQPFGQESRPKTSNLSLNSVSGFIVSNNLTHLTELNSGGLLQYRKGIGGISQLKRPADKQPFGKFSFEFTVPTPTYPGGNPKRTLGWHLRDGNAIWAIRHAIGLKPHPIGGPSAAQIYAFYSSDPKGITATEDPSSKSETKTAEEELPAEEDDETSPTELADAGAEENETPLKSVEEEDPLDERATAIFPTPNYDTLPEPALVPENDNAIPSEVTTTGFATDLSNRDSNTNFRNPSRSTASFPPLSQPVATDQIEAGSLSSASPSQGTEESSSLPSNPPSVPPVISPRENQLTQAIANQQPDQVPTDHPRVVRLIANWISQAEPPANIDPAVNLRYNEWGTAIGQAKGGIITQSGKPDQAAGLTSSEYLWIYRRDLESLHQCRMEDWVMAQLSKNPLGDCSSQGNSNTIAVPNVVGQLIDDAEGSIVSAGLVPLVTIGPPAPRLSDEGRIASQIPALGAALRPGETVEIEIFTNYVAIAGAPRLVSLNLDEAERRILDKGFVMDLRLGNQAPSHTEENSIEKQDPPAGAKIEEGAVITIWVHAPFVENAPKPDERVLVPDLVGLSANEAELIALERGLVLKRISGPSAPTPDQVFTILSQKPTTGTNLEPLSEIEVIVFGKSDPSKPNPGSI